ncbi:hypothetical protein AAS23_gp92 [Pantoea phage vB_PagS_AAS23]|uniref:Uncharacterized protein n=1 Tax=Pantoea phage vB_PagS_AAS23 TaxID=2499073 RepID=A0A3S9U7W2_9CAUD|nr:hypothetical protein HOU93_gp92 [Pantoea phage vB_PagS_AAS23]AZS06405.1 hypothetical protein AAS23_gp92 [Pantoea phage vB_PagS_AAS23]
MRLSSLCLIINKPASAGFFTPVLCYNPNPS